MADLRLAEWLARGVAVLIAQAVCRAVAMLAVGRHVGARHTVALRNLARHAGSGLRRVRSARGNCWGEIHGAFPFRSDAAAI
jgi:hypothetical protein